MVTTARAKRRLACNIPIVDKPRQVTDLEKMAKEIRDIHEKLVEKQCDLLGRNTISERGPQFFESFMSG